MVRVPVSSYRAANLSCTLPQPNTNNGEKLKVSEGKIRAGVLIREEGAQFYLSSTLLMKNKYMVVRYLLLFQIITFFNMTTNVFTIRLRKNV